MHTPGPWHVGDRREPMLVWGAGRGYVARINEDGGDQQPHAEANARLIAAAPDLLAALKLTLGALEYVIDSPHDSNDWETVKLARAAIAKATGQ